MSDEETKVIVEEEEKEEEVVPLEVKVVNKEVRESSPYDGHDDYEHEDLEATKEVIEEFENASD